ncbi:MAG: hypothetical protein IJZ10_00280 [Thermoguttaceae bacterium]|nr:hypothetical protein [Thermoguttaceae bacterium]
MEPTKKIQTGLLAIALGFGSAAFSLGGATTFGTDAPAQTPASAVLGVNSNAPSYPALVRSQELLLKARRSLMSRDVVAAERYVQEAQALNAQYGAASDRPEYVLPLVDQYKRAEAAARAQGMTEAVKRELAKSYLEQAEGLRRCQDLDAAENLVAEARKLNVVFDAATVERKMDVASVQRRVADDRLALAAPTASQAPLTGLSEATKRQVASAQETLRQARVLAANGQTERAEQAVRALQAQGIPESAFAGGDSPAQFLRDVAAARSQSSIRQVQATVPGVSTGESAGYLYVQEAETALAQGDKETALANYRDALRYTAELDAATVRNVNAEIARLTAPAAATPEVVATATGLDLTPPGDALQNEIAAFIAKQNQVRETAPKEAVADLKQLKAEIEASTMEVALKAHFAHALDVAIADSEAFLAANGSRIAIQQQNTNVDAFVAQKRAAELERQARLADDTEKFNDLLEEGRYDEAIVLAEKCSDYTGGDAIAVQMLNQAKFAKQNAFNNRIRDEKAETFLNVLNNVDEAAVVKVDDANPLVFNQDRWNIAKNRESLTAGSTRSEADLEILRKLEMQITLPFDQPMPLDVVVDYIRKNAEINVMIDEAALAEAGVTSDMAIPTNLANIKLKNYLKHSLTPLGLSYIVEDEVLTITGKNKRSDKTTLQFYPVADLVIGVPNFGNVVAPMSQEASQQRAFQQVANRGLNASAANTIPGLNQNVFGSNSTLLSPNIAAQIQSSGGNVPLTAGGGGMNDPSELIDLITSVVGDEETWEMVGDPQFFSLNNTLAIRQTEENHEEIHELLEKLRSLNDLQVAVEVRFITISDEYFERIGVNMNLSFKSDVDAGDLDDDQLVPSRKGVYGIYDAGSSGNDMFTENLNINFTQNSYGLAVPQFGNYDPSVGAQMGFAILSDIESYFFVSAAESDTRTNVLQAPKVTMFNGQTASVSDFTSVPYVSTVIPVVGEFAVAQQPVITVINEGQFMTVQATASPDRKYVRMTVVPFFCKITDNDRTFKFEGTDSVSTNSTTANKGSSILDSITDERETTSGAEVVSAGTTIQEPVTSSFSVYTTVNVPDGGTALLGGIKRLSEGRNEGGVPILSKIPYLKRLFSNSAIGRETTSMLMTVTPRIIIQEEEEEFATGANPGRD